jgi:hypothetical protein
MLQGRNRTNIRSECALCTSCSVLRRQSVLPALKRMHPYRGLCLDDVIAITKRSIVRNGPWPSQSPAASAR